MLLGISEEEAEEEEEEEEDDDDDDDDGDDNNETVTRVSAGLLQAIPLTMCLLKTLALKADGEDHDSRSDGGDAIDENDRFDGPVAAPALADTVVIVANGLVRRSAEATARKQAPSEEWPWKKAVRCLFIWEAEPEARKNKYDPNERRERSRQGPWTRPVPI